MNASKTGNNNNNNIYMRPDPRRRRQLPRSPRAPTNTGAATVNTTTTMPGHDHVKKPGTTTWTRQNTATTVRLQCDDVSAKQPRATNQVKRPNRK